MVIFRVTLARRHMGFVAYIHPPFVVCAVHYRYPWFKGNLMNLWTVKLVGSGLGCLFILKISGVKVGKTVFPNTHWSYAVPLA